MKTLNCVLGVLMTIVAVAVHGAPLVNNFSQDLGPVTVGNVAEAQTYKMPAILWGGEYMWFSGNGNNKTTQKGSTLEKFGVSLELVPGDDFYGQVRSYLKGESPFLRGTFGMIAMASEVIGNDSRTKPYVLGQMTWSRGDHAIARKKIKTVSQLKGAKVCLQKGGPHIEFLNDILETAKLDWSDITVIWAEDLNGPKGPAAKFKADPTIDVCFVVTPDMFALIGDPEKPGSGAEGTVADTHRLISTTELTRCIADVIAVRSDFYQAHTALCEKIWAAYLKESEILVERRKNAAGKEYRETLKFAVEFYGKNALPNQDEAHGLFMDCQPVGHPGNVVFFTEANNVTGFDAFNTKLTNLALKLGYAAKVTPLLPSPLDWNSKIFKDNLQNTQVVYTQRFKAEAVTNEIEALAAGGKLDEKTKYSFSINFAANQITFNHTEYAKDFEQVIDIAAKYSGAVVVVRGHTDPTKTLLHLINAGKAKGIIKSTGSPGNLIYSLNGKPLDLKATTEMIRLIESGQFDGNDQWNPREIMTAALRLSVDRAEAFKSQLMAYAQSKGKRLDASQISIQGVGIKEPFIAKPKDEKEAAANMRVECALVSVSPETSQPSDFDF